MKPKSKGGLRRLPDYSEDKPCRSREHDPPNAIVLKPGRYEYTCPACGHVTYFSVPETGSCAYRLEGESPKVRSKAVKEIIEGCSKLGGAI